MSKITEEMVEAATKVLNERLAKEDGLFGVSRDMLSAALSAGQEETTYSQEEFEEAYELGKRDGYEEAVQEIDQKTGGDGEYRHCLGGADPDRHTPDPETMIQRIVDRFETLNLLDEAIKEDPTLGVPPAVPGEVARPSYQQIIDLVQDCVRRMQDAGESHRMLARWISEGLAALSAGQAQPVAYQYRWKLDGEWTNWRVSDASQKSPNLKDLEERPLYALTVAESIAEAARIGDAVLSWMVKYDILDAGNEYRAEDVVAALNDIAPHAGPSAPDGMREALSLVIEYDDLLQHWEGPEQVLLAGDVEEIDAAYDKMVAACRAALGGKHE